MLGFDAAIALTGCATSPGESAAYIGLDEGWKRIRPFADSGLNARADLSDSEKAFVRTTLDNHGRLIADLKSGKAGSP